MPDIRSCTCVYLFEGRMKQKKVVGLPDRDGQQHNAQVEHVGKCRCVCVCVAAKTVRWIGCGLQIGHTNVVSATFFFSTLYSAHCTHCEKKHNFGLSIRRRTNIINKKAFLFLLLLNVAWRFGTTIRTTHTNTHTRTMNLRTILHLVFSF